MSCVYKCINTESIKSGISQRIIGFIVECTLIGDSNNYEVSACMLQLAGDLTVTYLCLGQLIENVTVYGLAIDYSRKNAKVYKLIIDYENKIGQVRMTIDTITISDGFSRIWSILSTSN